mmetsp:Transcript_12455/g.18271  ORF Transcript_12455/g.18271 Transcript_12455/m.18271 type:complete len:237 (-) Transcript_12455:428-1138(-)
MINNRNISSFFGSFLLLFPFLQCSGQSQETCYAERETFLKCARKVQELYATFAPTTKDSLDNTNYHEYFCRDETENFIDCEKSGMSNGLDICGAEYITDQWARCYVLRPDCVLKCGNEMDLSMLDTSCDKVQANNCKRKECCPDELCTQIVEYYESCVMKEFSTCSSLIEGCENIFDDSDISESFMERVARSSSMFALWVSLGVCCAIGVAHLIWRYSRKRRQMLVHEEILPQDNL